ncbi:MAG TPA: ATP-dependent RecD-like DNA helicase [Clostridia bacterium]
MKIEGTVEDIIYRNEENGYTVMIIDNGGEPVTCVGYFPMLSEGEYLCLEGENRYNSKYGMQFAVKNIASVSPQTTTGIVSFLASGLIHGVGEVTATRIVDKFGLKTFEIIEKSPERLAEIKGISLEKANSISESYKSVQSMREAVMFLQSYGISPSLSLKIYREYGNQVKEIVLHNPYKLVEDIEGIGFVTADKIAQKIGIKKDSEFRLRAGIIYILNTAAERNGHTYLPIEELNQNVLEVLSVNKTAEELYDFYEKMVIDGKLKFYTKPEHRCIALSYLYHVEKNIAQRLLTLIQSADDLKNDYSEDIERYEQKKGYKFDSVQKKAISSCLNDGVLIITGGPGTGKTTIISCVLDILRIRGGKFLLLAPTGRAAKRMQEATGEEAMTIHRALQPDFKGHGFMYNENNPLEYDYIIVDEISMIDAFLMNGLLKAIRSGTHLILLGDKDQLPSVGAGNVLADLLLSGKLPITYLTHIYRQSDTSNIVTNAHLINNGKMPVIDNSASKDFFFLSASSPERILSATVEMVTQRLTNFTGFSPQRIQVLAPMKNGVAGVINLNRQLQNSLNPASPNKPEITYGNQTFRVGDKVMHIANNYELEWQKVDESGIITSGVGVFNGDMGIVISVTPSTGELVVEFEDGRRATYGAETMEELMLAYAITVHKSQGCEFDACVIVLTGGSYMINTRNLLYTALTRAKNYAVLIGEKETIRKMVNNTFTQTRYTMLREMLDTYSNQMELFS